MASPSSCVEDDRNQAYSRKQKSLALLCTNFVGLYDKNDVESISLDDAAKKLGVERRRIYDIVNVMESVGVLARKAKNRYSWIGFSGIPKTLELLKEEVGTSRVRIDGNCIQASEDEEDERSIDRDDGIIGEENWSSALQKPRCVPENKKEKSLGQLTQNFVKLFLTSDVDIVSLDEAAALLLGDCHDPTQMKKRVRLVCSFMFGRGPSTTSNDVTCEHCVLPKYYMCFG